MREVTKDEGAHVLRLGNALRREVHARNRGRLRDIAHELTGSESPAVLYAEDDAGNHGNFLPASYKRILARPAWRGRLSKAYTASARVPHAGLRQRSELDCAASSDALLMNIFCHPAAMKSQTLRSLLAMPRGATVEFGVRMHVPLRDGYLDRTEMDMRLQSGTDTLLVEAKLSEGDFQHARAELLERYESFADTFDVTLLPRSRGGFRSYQLLRCVLAAKENDCRFAVFLDRRRTDLLDDVFLVYRAVRGAELRGRLHVVTWQEIARCLPSTLRTFLAEKYGIDAAR